MPEHPLRIALLLRRFSRRGGNERVATEFVRELSARGHVISVYCQKSDSTVEDLLPPEQIQRLSGVGFDPAAAMLSFAFAARRQVHQLRAVRAVDVVVGFHESVEQDLARLGGGTHAAYRLAVPEQTRRHPLLDRVALGLERARVRHTPHFIAPSARVRDELIGLHQVAPERITVIVNGVDLERYRPEGPAAERAAVRARWGVAPHEPIALFVGQDPIRKGYDLAVEVCRRAGCTLVYAGPARVERAPHVILDGQRADLEASYRAADLMIAPSRYEPLGCAQLEALASGLPVVASSFTGATEVMTSSPALARLVVGAPEDLAALTGAVRTALDPSGHAALRIAARAAVANLTWRAFGDASEAAVRRAVRG